MTAMSFSFLSLLCVIINVNPSQCLWEWLHDTNETPSNPAQVFELDPDLNDNRTSMMRLKFPERSLSPPFSVCFMLFPIYFNATEAPLTLSDGQNFFELILLEGHIEVTINQSCPYPTEFKQIKAHHWHQVCTVVNHSMSFQLYLDGEKYEIDLTSQNECNRPPFVTDSVTVLLGSDRNGFEFSGKISHLKVFQRNLTYSEIQQLALCQKGPEDHLKNFTAISEGVLSKETNLSYLCEPPPSEFMALFEEHTNQEGAHTFCQMLKGRLVNSSDNLGMITRQISSNKDIKETSVLFWMNEKSEADHGFVLNVNRGKCPQKLKYTQAVICPITACMLPFGNPVLQKGESTETLYTFPHKGKLTFQSKDGYTVSKDRCPMDHDYYCLVGKQRGEVIMYTYLVVSKMPLGRKSWKTPNTSLTHNITLGHCAKGQFTCSDGECIGLNEKCDGQPDCMDESDEGTICQHIQLSTAYQMNICPETFPKTELAVNLDSVREVLMDKSEMSVVLTITSTWRDSRLTFMNLNNNTTSLYYGEAKHIWYPKLLFSNSRYGDNLVMQSDVDPKFVLRYYLNANKKGTETLKDSYEVQEHKGNDVDITRSVQYLYTFHCAYNYSLYPFDTQECKMAIEPLSTPGCLVILKTKADRMPVQSKLTTVSMYTVSNAHYCYGSLAKGGNAIYLHLLLSRNFSSHLLTIFIPCIILCLLSMLTLTHFELCNFTDRITVTLSLLIVLASLFSQVSTTLPESPVPKMVDMFFSYCIIRVSFAFFIHCLIEKSIRTAMLKSQTVVKFVTPEPSKKAPKLPCIRCKRKKRTLRTNMPKIINTMGIITIICVDICIVCTFSYLALSDWSEKIRRLDDLLSKYEMM